MRTTSYPKVSTPAAALQPGDVILPPARELRLWMKAGIAAGTLSPDALRITLAVVEPGFPDTRGPWLVLRGHDATPRRTLWTIRVRPDTPWPVLGAASLSPEA